MRFRFRRFVLMATTALSVAGFATHAEANPALILLPAAAASLSAAIGGAKIAAIIGAGILGGITAAASQLLTPKPDFGNQAFSQQVPSQENAQPRRIIYGRARVAPAIPYSAVTNNERVLHLVHVLAGHECDGLEEIWFNEEKVWDEVDGWGTFKGKDLTKTIFGNPRAAMTFHAGTEDQLADPDLVAAVGEWTDDHRGRGVCWVYLRLFGDDKTYAQTGLPRVTYVVRGRKVYDPRTDTTAWSDNAALCINDWVLYNRYGYREKPKFWDEAGSVVAAANISDELVSLAEGGSEKRYRISGGFAADADKEDVLRGLLASCAGMVPREGAHRRLLVGAWRPPVVELTDDDLAGRVEITVGKPKAETFTAVRGRFASPDSDWLPDEYPEVVSDAHDPAEGDPRYYSLDQPMTPAPGQAQRIAKLTLLSQRQRIVVTADWKLRALRLRAGDTFMWTMDRYGWAQKIFEVTDRALVVEGGSDKAPRMRIAMTVRETGASVHDWTISDQAPYVAGVPTLLPDPFAIDPPTVTVSDVARVYSEQVVNVLVVTASSPSANAAGFEVQARRVGTTDVVALGRGAQQDDDETLAHAFELPFVEKGGAYEARGRAITYVGSPSDWSDWVEHQVVGLIAAPPDVDSFNITRLPDGTRRFDWDASTPAYVLSGGGFQIRSALGTGVSWEAMTPVHKRLLSASPWETNELAAGQWTFGIKMIDPLGQESATAQIIEATLGAPRLQEVLVFRDERQLGWPGTKVDCYVSDEGNLEAESTQGWGDLPASWDALADNWREMVASKSPITYTTPEIDLGTDVDFNPLTTVEPADNVTVTIQTGTSADGGAVGSFVAPASQKGKRYVRLRISIGGTHPYARSMTVILDGETQVERYEDIDTSAASSGVVERLGTGHFKLATRGKTASITSAAILAFQNAGSGWTAEVVSKATTITGSPEPAAEFRIYKDGVLADAVIDAEIKGPKK